eukprot:CAMPEP_0184691200 /NCGR_PEP_ID=MMETSP0313-20130426/105_1 /TAXON_ID=2792 /ORGANISM="Porphyridium aerugineum, Strain SAG 1380-2" /LENGTH=115 /DNA_ID=CAMNT_0027148875 /DNA_START=1350 /DNA_END=1697 /DNA_ORIENTATION=+
MATVAASGHAARNAAKASTILIKSMAHPPMASLTKAASTASESNDSLVRSLSRSFSISGNASRPMSWERKGRSLERIIVTAEQRKRCFAPSPVTSPRTTQSRLGMFLRPMTNEDM